MENKYLGIEAVAVLIARSDARLTASVLLQMQTSLLPARHPL
jgi:hypothetical protein